MHIITKIIEETLEEKIMCSAVFLDVAQAFDKVWIEGFIYKLKSQLQSKFRNFLNAKLKINTLH